MRVLIAEEEPAHRKRLRDLLERESDLQVVAECADGRKARAAIERLRPDIVFLAAALPGQNGFAVVRALGPEQCPPVVFLSEDGRQAARAFEVRAIDYLVHPVTARRLAESLERARALVKRENLEELSDRLTAAIADPRFGKRYARRLLAREEGRLIVIDVGEIDWIEAEGKNVRLHIGARAHRLRELIGRLETRLDPARFLRIHRSAIVNVDRIDRIEPAPGGGQQIVLADGMRLPLSRASRVML